MSKFKDRLWRELLREHGAELAQMTPPAAKRARRARPRLLAGTTVGLAGVGTALALALSAASSSPAFAVTKNHDGTVSVVITRLTGISGANKKLAQLGVRARAVQVVAGCVPGSLPPAMIESLRIARGVASGRFHQTVPAVTHAVLRGNFRQVRINPRKIPAGRTLVLAAWGRDRNVRVAGTSSIRGAAPGCLPPLPPPTGPGRRGVVSCHQVQPPAGGNSGNSGNSGTAPIPPTGNSGASGNSGATGNSGAGQVPVPNRPRWQIARGAIMCESPVPPAGNPSGNRGATGNS